MYRYRANNGCHGNSGAKLVPVPSYQWLPRELRHKMCTGTELQMVATGTPAQNVYRYRATSGCHGDSGTKRAPSSSSLRSRKELASQRIKISVRYDLSYHTIHPTVYPAWRVLPAVPIIINGTLARSLEPVVTECKEHTIHTQTQVVASRKPKEIKRTHEGEANFTT